MWQAYRTPWSLSSGGTHSAHLQDDRRRRELDEPDAHREGAADGRHRQDRARGLAGQDEPRVGPHRARLGRRVSQRRRRRERGSTSTATASCASAHGTTRSYADPKDPERRLRAERRLLPLQGRRQDVPGEHQPAARRQPRPVDRARRSEADDRGQRRRRERVVQRAARRGRRRSFATAQFYHVSDDQRVSVPGLRRAAGQLDAVRAEPEGRRHRHRGLVRRGRRRVAATSPPHPTQPERDLRRQLRRPADAQGPAHRTSSATSPCTRTTRWATRRRTSRSASSGRSRSCSRATTRTCCTRAATSSSARPTRGRAGRASRPTCRATTPQTMGRRAARSRRTRRASRRTASSSRSTSRRSTTGLLWAGTDDGYVWISRDNGANWSNVTPKDLGDFTRVSIIEPSPHAACGAYMAANRYQLGDKRPILYKTADCGKTWTKHRRRHPRDRVHARHPRGSGAARAALRRHRARRVGLVRRRRPLAVAAQEPAAGAGARPRDQGGRPHRRHARPRRSGSWTTSRRCGSSTPQTVAKTTHSTSRATRIAWTGAAGSAAAVARGGANGATRRRAPSSTTTCRRRTSTSTLEFLDAAGKVIRSFTSDAGLAPRWPTACAARRGAASASTRS